MTLRGQENGEEILVKTTEKRKDKSRVPRFTFSGGTWMEYEGFSIHFVNMTNISYMEPIHIINGGSVFDSVLKYDYGANYADGVELGDYDLEVFPYVILNNKIHNDTVTHLKSSVLFVDR